MNFPKPWQNTKPEIPGLQVVMEYCYAYSTPLMYLSIRRKGISTDLTDRRNLTTSRLLAARHEPHEPGLPIPSLLFVFFVPLVVKIRFAKPKA
ncbi:hypothetical protein FACS189447_06270 [Spirochaetia bacterium]|nr:hypothetical protein FACS189447_06270 [Spirochaetia bacterium]